MKHILIVTYGFPPANNMAAHRNHIRAKGFDEQGYRVSVVTRCWQQGQTGAAPLTDTSPLEITSEKMFSNTTVYRVPFGPDRLAGLNVAQAAVLRLRRWLGHRRCPALLKRTLENFCFFTCPLDYAFRLAVQPADLACRLESPPDFVLASGDPWSNFELGRELAAFFRAKYIAEYRDPWNYTDEKFRIDGFNAYNANLVSRLKRGLSARRERRVNQGADLIIAASPPFLENALAMTGAQSGLVVTNGFDRAEIDAVKTDKYDRFTLCYVGTIYSQQRAEIFFQALQNFLDKHGIDPKEICVKMIGSKFSHGFDRTMKRIQACRDHLQILEFPDRVAKEESLKIQKSSSVLLFFAHEKSVGIIPGKFFEYIAVGIPVLLVPSDRGVLADIIRQTGTGSVCDTVEETVEFLEQAYFSWKKTGRVLYSPDRKAIERYSYQEITQMLIRRLEAT